MSLYTENEEKWKSLSDIDYFTQFVKVWIPFNAWFKNSYPSLNSDRLIINEIKTNSNRIRDKALNFLSRDPSDPNVLKFHQYVGQLHHQLEQTHVNNDKERITFSKLFIEPNPNTLETVVSRSITYKVERTPTAGNIFGTVAAQLISSANVSVFSFAQSKYDLAELKDNPSFQNLSQQQKGLLEECYKKVNPRKPTSLILARLQRNEECLELANYRFINSPEIICKGVIEAIYLLRCSLFHGEIIPDRETGKVYEQAYHIIKLLID